MLNKMSTRNTTILILAVLILASWFIRIYFPFNHIFTPLGVKFSSSDAYYHMRLVDLLSHNFPHFHGIDPFYQYPTATNEIKLSFWIWLLTVPAWIAGLGSPSAHLINTIAAFMPAILGGLVIIPVYFIGREVFGRWAGFISAALTVIVPGEFLGRSVLGFTDYHVAEALFTTTAIMFLIFAMKTAFKRQITFQHIRDLDWVILKRPLVYTLLAGLFMGIYIWTWPGALLFVFILFVYFVLQFIVSHLKGKSIEGLVMVSSGFFLVSLIISKLVSAGSLYTTSLLFAILVPIVLGVISWYFRDKKLNVIYFPLIIAVVGAASIGLLYLVDKGTFQTMISSFSIFKPSGAQLTTIEMQPLLTPINGNPLYIPWTNFGTGFYLAFIGMAILAYRVVVEDTPLNLLVLIWSLIMLVAVLGQRRFGYYYAVNVVLLSGYLSWMFLEWAAFKQTAEKVVKGTKAAGARARAALRKQSSMTPIFIKTVYIIIVFFAVFFWDFSPTMAIAKGVPYAPSNAWVNSMIWMRDNTPPPMGSAADYYKMYDKTTEGADFKYPSTAYGVMSWWDYGYWITRIGHRIPDANPGQSPTAIKNVASFMTAQNETVGDEVMDKLNSKYVVLDNQTAYVSPQNGSGKLTAIITWDGQSTKDYFDVYVLPTGNQSNPSYRQILLYTPEYFRAMAVRLYNFDGKAVTPQVTTVISYHTQKDANNVPFKMIDGAQQFKTYQEAEAFLSGNHTGNYEIVSTSPMSSPVPLAAMTHYKLVHSSAEQVPLDTGNTTSEVKIFEYTK